MSKFLDDKELRQVAEAIHNSERLARSREAGAYLAATLSTIEVLTKPMDNLLSSTQGTIALVMLERIRTLARHAVHNVYDAPGDFGCIGDKYNAKQTPDAAGANLDASANAIPPFGVKTQADLVIDQVDALRDDIMRALATINKRMDDQRAVDMAAIPQGISSSADTARQAPEQLDPMDAKYYPGRHLIVSEVEEGFQKAWAIKHVPGQILADVYNEELANAIVAALNFNALSVKQPGVDHVETEDGAIDGPVITAEMWGKRRDGGTHLDTAREIRETLSPQPVGEEITYYGSGRVAHQSGIKLKDCPYKGQEGKEWRRGWNDSAQEIPT